jgi:hypothetical protein
MKSVFSKLRAIKIPSGTIWPFGLATIFALQGIYHRHVGDNISPPADAVISLICLSAAMFMIVGANMPRRNESKMALFFISFFTALGALCLIAGVVTHEYMLGILTTSGNFGMAALYNWIRRRAARVEREG